MNRHVGWYFKAGIVAMEKLIFLVRLPKDGSRIKKYCWGRKKHRLVDDMFYFTSTEASHVMVWGHITTMIRPTSMSLQNGKAPQKISVVFTSGGATPLR